MLFGNGTSKSRRYIRENVMLYTCFVCEYVRGCVCALCPYSTPREYDSFCWNKSTSLLGTVLKLLLRQTRTVRGALNLPYFKFYFGTVYFKRFPGKVDACT